MKRLKELRLQKGLTQQQVANAIGKTYQAYSYYENGKRDPDTETLKLLADFFNVSTDYLLEAPQSVENKKIPKDLKKILLARKAGFIFLLKVHQPYSRECLRFRAISLFSEMPFQFPMRQPQIDLYLTFLLIQFAEYLFLL